MIIAQITDLHIGFPAKPGDPQNDQRLTETLDAIKALKPRPDLILATGDLTNDGYPEQYERLLELFADCDKMLLLDEPTAGINPTLINGIIDRLIKVNQDFGITLLVIEHNMKVIMQLAEDIFCLAHGKMLANGSPDEIKNDKRVIDAYLGAQ